MPAVLAIAAHPDDIEFVMAGTMLRLVALGWDAHYFNIANGCCGSTELSREHTAEVRLEEAMAAAEAIPAEFHPPIRDDLDIFYDRETLREVAAVVRRVRPSIILTHAPVDYMEDHQNAARLAVGGAFVRCMPNFETSPPVEPFHHDVAVYHAQPHGNRDPLGHIVVPSLYVDVTDLIPRKRKLLGFHRSQAQWLDASQQMNSYIQTMEDLNREVGLLSETFDYAEGWRKHLHLGLSASNYDPLRVALAGSVK
ncbi:MAG: LmbE family protein [Planctomycetota bacterium]|nr:MAG: LmbE family protein [Planctomycetota bacterium]